MTEGNIANNNSSNLNGPVKFEMASSSSSSTYNIIKCDNNTNNNSNNNNLEMNKVVVSKKLQHNIIIPAAVENITCNNNSSTTISRIRLGICCLDKKGRSKPMAEILSRLDAQLFHVIFFGDDVILNKSIEEWPICDVLIAFFSKGYPLQKAIDYVQLRKPFILNDLHQQRLMQDRRRVYDLLEASGIDTPRHAYCSRDGYKTESKGNGNGTLDILEEYDDHIIVNGITIHKPFVEKPVNAEDHNICIYYPTSAGGGCKKLFRKIGNRSSEFYPNIHEVRRDGSFIYEEFVETQGTDVKMYTVGPEYGHAEARKSPTVDGKVERDPNGKEIRFPVILSYQEKEIARRIVLVFKQFVCGFDILRVQEGHSITPKVCDVNGWSFVKNSRKYYDDCAQILSEHILAMAKPAALKSFSTLDPLVTTSLNRQTAKDLALAARIISANKTPTKTKELLTSAASLLMEGAKPVREFSANLLSEPASFNQSGNTSVEAAETPTNNNETHEEELRCVLAIVRHGDRTPKQKLKVNVRHPRILKFFHDRSKDCKKELKVKDKTPLTDFLNTVKETLAEIPKDSDKEGSRYQLMHMRDILERWKIVGLNRKIQIKPREFEEYTDEKGETKVRCIEVQLILKWGGNLTKLGEKQSIRLGRKLRHDLYPDSPGGGILRLHSTFRHDLKIKTSDEGRVMKTAAAFAKGLLELDGDLPPILVSLVHKEKDSMHMLDPSGNKEVKSVLDDIKDKVTANLQKDIDISKATEEELELMVGPPNLTGMRDAIRKVGNPRKTLVQIHETMKELLDQLDEMLDEMGSGDEKIIENGEEHIDFALSGVKLYKGETLLELTERWRFIYDRLYDSDTESFDLSRIPDVHDNIRFDVLHNPHLGLSSTLHRLYNLAKSMADCVVPQEYGTTLSEKRSIGVKICHGLLDKISFDLKTARTDKHHADIRYLINMDYSADLPINTMGRRIRTRLYFTSESHLHTVLNTLRFAGDDNNGSYLPLLSDEGIEILNATPELCYLTHIVFRVFEDSRPEMANDPRRFRVEILFSAGATATPLHLDETNRDLDLSRIDSAPLQMIGREGLTCEEVEKFLDMVMEEGYDHGEQKDDMSIDA